MASSAPASLQEGVSRPDIIFLMTDQQRWDALGILNPHVITPHLDRLAQSGILYTDAVCQAPICVPSRFSMMTGLYPSQSGVRSNDWGTPRDEDMPVKVIPEMLREAGYLTVGFGKTHWAAPGPTSTRGFDIRVVGCREVGVEIGARHWQDDENPEGLARYRKETANYGPGEEEVPGYVGRSSEVADRDHRDGWVAEKCLEWLESDEVDSEKPLFFYLSFLKPHAGHNPPPRYEALYDINTIPDIAQPPWEKEGDTHTVATDEGNDFLGGRTRKWRAAWSRMTPMERRWATLRYWANCTWFDDIFGQVLAKLEKRGRLTNALILFTSDHGELLGERQHRFSKYCLYESSVRVPFILSGSALRDDLRGIRSDRALELIDLYPTLAAAAGGTVPKGLPGENIFEPGRRRGTFAEFHDSGGPAWMWRTETHKLILFAPKNSDKAKGELYDLRNDPHEWHNLFAEPSHADVREKLVLELWVHIATCNGRWPEHSPGFAE